MDNDFQQQVMMEQRRAMILAAMRRISSIAFEKCIKAPSSALSSREADCVQKTALRFLDTSKFISDSFMQQNN